MKQYPSYVVTAESSMPKIPEHWRLLRMKNIGRALIGLTYSPDDIVDSKHEGTLVIRAGNIQNGRLRLTDNVYVDKPIPDDLRLRPGDIVVCARNGSAQLIGKSAIATPEVAGQTWGAFMVVLRTTESNYLRWVLNSRIFAAQTGMFSTATINQLTSATLSNLRFAMPPPSEQLEIANFLDRETARIDTLIAEQLRLIEMFRERRVATIAEALDGHEMTRLRRLVDPERPMTYGILQCGEPVSEGVPYIGPSDITGEGLSPERNALRTTTTEIANAYRRSVLAGGDVVVSIGPAYGKIAVVSSGLTGVNLTQDTVRVALRPDLADSRFVVWALLSRQTDEYWDSQIMGATFRRLNLGTLARTPIPLIPIDEQRRIAHYLDEQTARIDTLIAETERFIELSKERRSALITAAVTGQIDVRETV